MLDILRRLAREPAALLGAVTAGLGLAVLFGAQISLDQTAGIATFLGAVMILLRFVLTPTSEVLVQRDPDGLVHLGAAAERVDLAEVPPVNELPYVGQHRRSDRGATDTQQASVVVTLLLLAALAAALLFAGEDGTGVTSAARSWR